MILEISDSVVQTFNISPFSIKGTGFVLEIYFYGCNNSKCKDYCINKQFQKINHASFMSVFELFNAVKAKLEFVDEIHFLGGEPLLNEHRLNFIKAFIELCKRYKPTLIFVLFTGKEKRELDFSKLSCFNFIKCGHFDINQPPKEISSTFILASANQEIISI